LEHLDEKRSKKVAKAAPVKLPSPAVEVKENITMDQAKKVQIIREQPKRRTTPKKPARETGGIKKEYFGADSSCSVTLRLPKEAVGAADRVMLVGDFNNWDNEAMPMKRRRNGDFEITIELRSGREYRFRYLIDGCRWENDWHADNYSPNPYGCDDSVLII
jgi:hypothetical protein